MTGSALPTTTWITWFIALIELFLTWSRIYGVNNGLPTSVEDSRINYVEVSTLRCLYLAMNWSHFLHWRFTCSRRPTYQFILPDITPWRQPRCDACDVMMTGGGKEQRSISRLLFGHCTRHCFVCDARMTSWVELVQTNTSAKSPVKKQYTNGHPTQLHIVSIINIIDTSSPWFLKNLCHNMHASKHFVLRAYCRDA